jgi:hypothetical protein
VDERLSREELRGRLRALRTAVIWGSGIAFVAALGLVDSNPQGTQAATDGGSPDSTQQQPVEGSSTAVNSPVTNAPDNQAPLLHSRRS